MAIERGGTHAATMWASLGFLIFGFIRLGGILLITTCPILLVCLLVVQPLRSFALFTLALLLSSPGIAAAFATFRDSPDLGYSPLRRKGEADNAIEAGYVAAPRWKPEEEHKILRPYLRSLKQLSWRSLIVSAVTLGITVVLLYDRQWAAASSFKPFAPAFLVAALVMLSVWFTALAMVVELPLARWWAVVRASLFLSIRKWYLSLLNLVVLVGWMGGILYAPVLMPVFGTPLLLHLVWANSRWITMPMIKQLELEATPSGVGKRQARADRERARAKAQGEAWQRLQRGRSVERRND